MSGSQLEKGIDNVYHTLTEAIRSTEGVKIRDLGTFNQDLLSYGCDGSWWRRKPKG